MNTDMAVELARQALITSFVVSAPILALGFVAGVVVSIVQILTSMQDPAFNTIPRLAAFLAGALVLLPWMTERLVSYTIALFSNLKGFAR
ncbi:MAG TPA: flagellar biosynthetic protein FliQ [Bryobacterales bacterium]|jgi:flagellar biosynthetic protein FliQ|nr:flagellar biosynthetic protein FliQ [Bryobacterales bacterium]